MKSESLNFVLFSEKVWFKIHLAGWKYYYMIYLLLLICLNSFRYKGPKIWNSNYIKETISLSEFKFLIKSSDGPQCLCNLCQTAGNQSGLWIKMSQLPFVHIIYIMIQMFMLKLLCLCVYMWSWI